MSIQIRPAVPADAPALLAIYAPYVAQTAITFEYDVPTETEFACRIADTLKKYPYLVAEQDGVPVGYAYAGKFHDRAAYDWSVDFHLCGTAPETPWHRQTAPRCPGTGTAAAAFPQYERLHRLPYGRKRPLSDTGQHPVPRKAGLPDGGRIPSVRL